MDWSAATWWWVGAGVLVAAELLTGTFYLLMVALGCVAGAIASHLGGGGTAQLITASLVGGGATAGWHGMRAREPRSQPAATNRDVNLDIGQLVQVPAWSADGTARVRYRGADWKARHRGAGAPVTGEHVIVAVEGSELGLEPHR